MTEPIRLSKRLIELVGCSRREAELYIEGGWVLVDGMVVEEPQFKIEQQRVELHPDAVLTLPEPVTLLVHLRAGEAPAAALAALSAATRWPDDASGMRQLKNHFTRLTPLVALPAEASGLHVLTQDYRVQRKLTEDLNKLEQEYVVEVSGDIQSNGLKRLNQSFNHGGAVLPACKVSWQNETRLRIAVKNPQPGQLLKLCESVGLQVLTMKRIRIGGVPMSKLQPGQWRYLTAKERF
ncbi:MAG: RNA-binding domain protein [Verrucomicrobiaceae bacterium]|nr:RNA-binding domain protein [Verrucomicrobiaceae bacterium]